MRWGKVFRQFILIMLVSSYLEGGDLLAGEEELHEQGKAVLTAEKIIYDYDHNLLVAKGDALLKYEGVIIRSSELHLDADENTLKSVGYTELEQNEKVISGENIFYDLHTEQGGLWNFYSEGVSETGESMIISGAEMEINGEVLTYNQSTFTSCDREKTHYHLTAKKVEYHPEDRIIFYHVVYYEGKYPLFYWPKLVVSLEDRENNFSESVFGYNEIDGWFLKVVYRYYLESGSDGRLLLDLFERRGIGEGILHRFEVDDDRELSVSAYHFADEIMFSDDYQFGLEWKHKINSLYDYSLTYEYWLRTYQAQYGWWDEEYSLYAQIYGRDKVYPFNVTLDTGVYGGTNPIFYAKPKLNLEWRPTGQTRLTYSGFWDYKKPLDDQNYYSSSIEEKYRHTLSLSHNWTINGGDPFRFRAEFYESMDLSEEPNPYWRDWNRLPYLSLQTPQFNLDFLGNYRITLDYLRLQEVPSLIEGQRSEFILTRREQPIFTMGNFTLNLVGSARKQNYWLETGEYIRRAFTAGVEGVNRFTDHLTLRNRLTWTEADGAAPTEYYQLVNNSSYYMPNGNVRSGLYYQTKDFRANLQGGYNLSADLENPWHLVTTSASWNRDYVNRIDFNTSYNPNTKEYGNVNLIARYQPDDHNYLRLDLIYNPREQMWSTLDLETKLRRNLFWYFQLDLDVLYSFFGDGLERSRYGLVYDWHCRELYIGYDTIRQEYAFQIQYKVFPNAGFGFGSSDPGFTLGDN